MEARVGARGDPRPTPSVWTERGSCRASDQLILMGDFGDVGWCLGRMIADNFQDSFSGFGTGSVEKSDFTSRKENWNA